MKAILKILLFQLMAFGLFAQDEIIKPSGSGMSLFDDSGIEHIRIVTSDSETLLIEVKCNNDDDKTYVLSAELQDLRKKKMSAFTCKPQELPKGSETVDLAFTVSKKNASSKSNLKSSYIQVKMVEKEDDDSILGDLGNLLGGDDDNPLGDMFSKKYTFKFVKDWRLKGNKSMVINVPLTPVGDAKTLK